MIKRLAATAMGSLVAPGVATALIDQAEFYEDKLVIPKDAVYETTFTGRGLRLFMKNKHFKAEIDGKTYYPKPVKVYDNNDWEQGLKIDGLFDGEHRLKITPKDAIVLNFKGEWVDDA